MAQSAAPSDRFDSTIFSKLRQIWLWLRAPQVMSGVIMTDTHDHIAAARILRDKDLCMRVYTG
jgi:hypothetical protein